MASTVCPAENVIACWVDRLPEGGLLAFRGLLPHRSPLQMVNNLLLTPFSLAALNMEAAWIQQLQQPNKEDSRIARHVYQHYPHSMLAIRLDPEIEKRLDALAKKTGRTKTFYAREAILEHLEDLEDVYLATERLQCPTKTYSAEDVKHELGL